MDPNTEIKKICFVISPIGSDDSDTRARSIKILQKIIKPALDVFGYEMIWAGEMWNNGKITNQIFQQIYDANLIIADLTDHNPNVFYELAVAHVMEKHVIPLIIGTGELPFDNKDQRTIICDNFDDEKILKAHIRLMKQLESIRSSNKTMESPIPSNIIANFKKNNSLRPRKIVGTSLNQISIDFGIIKKYFYALSNSQEEMINVEKLKNISIKFDNLVYMFEEVKNNFND